MIEKTMMLSLTCGQHPLPSHSLPHFPKNTTFPFHQSSHILMPSKKRNPLALWGGLAALLVVISATVWFVAKPSDSQATPQGAGSMADLAPVPAEWGIGNPNAKLRIVEFGDYQCGACGYFHPIIKQVMEEFGDEVYFVFRHFPLPSHQFAKSAATAAEAAGRQGKFWEMHDLIMSNQGAWSRGIPTTVFLQMARQLGLNDIQFQQDLRNADIAAKIDRDFNTGRQLNIPSVPAFFFNGVYIQNPADVEGFRNLIKAELAKL
jgi:protein-disulfide isomerase